MGSVLLITFEVSVLHIILDFLCTSIGSIVFKCESKDTNLFSNIQIFNVKTHDHLRRRARVSGGEYWGDAYAVDG